MRIWWGRRAPGAVDHELIWGLIATLALAAAVVLPHFVRYIYHCPFLRVTGHPCFSCGMTRSWIVAGSGHFLRALRWNPVGLGLFVFSAIYVPYAWTVTLLRLPRLHITLTRRWELVLVTVLAAAVVAGNWYYLWVSGWPPG